MPADPRHSESAFETVIEANLLQYSYQRVPAAGFDRERAIFPETVLVFLRAAGPQLPDQIREVVVVWHRSSGLSYWRVLARHSTFLHMATRGVRPVLPFRFK